MPEQELTQVSRPETAQPGRLPPETHYHGMNACDKVHDPEPGEPTDPVMLAIERDQAWEMMKYHERLAEQAGRELHKERDYRRRMEIKARALDRIAIMLAQTSKVEWLELTAVIKDANQKVERMAEALKEKAKA